MIFSLITQATRDRDIMRANNRAKNFFISVSSKF